MRGDHPPTAAELGWEAKDQVVVDGEDGHNLGGQDKTLDKTRPWTLVTTLVDVGGSSPHICLPSDGKQTRSFTFINDCVEGILRIAKSDVCL